MSTNNTATKAYTLRSGTLWRTDDATAVTAVTVPLKPGRTYLIRTSGTYTNMTSGFGLGAFDLISCVVWTTPGIFALAGATVAVFSSGAGVVTPVVVGTDLQIRVTGVAANSIAWQVAVDVLEGGQTAANTGWTNG